MRLPNAAEAIVPLSKITDYLFSETNKLGAGKGDFLRLNGFDVSSPSLVQQLLRDHGRQNEVAEVIETEFGVKYRVDGWLQAPDGRKVFFRTVWQTDRGQTEARFVTLRPLPRRPE